MARTALLVGATGLVGGHVLDRLLREPRWSRVVVLARRPTGRTHEKLTERIVDFEKLAPLGQDTPIDDVFACLGTTIKVAGSQERFRRVDHDYTVTVARLAHDAGARRLALVSSVGASAQSHNFYLRVKGETEGDVRQIGYDSLVIARPSLLVGERSEARTGERVGSVVMGAVAPLMLGPLRAYRPIAARDVATALVEALAAGEAGERILTHEQLVALRRTTTAAAASP
jgi:uncharacterized protein YbjT (DUF2867 family)